MKIVRGKWPPNFREIVKAMPQARKPGVIFAYDDCIYAPPGAGEITPHLMKHEAVHLQRQKEIGVELWWQKYLTDKNFRYHEEVLAHRAEYQSLIEFGMKESKALQITGKRLASPLYGYGGGYELACDDILDGFE